MKSFGNTVTFCVLYPIEYIATVSEDLYLETNRDWFKRYFHDLFGPALEALDCFVDSKVYTSLPVFFKGIPKTFVQRLELFEWYLTGCLGGRILWRGNIKEAFDLLPANSANILRNCFVGRTQLGFGIPEVIDVAATVDTYPNIDPNIYLKFLRGC